MKPMKLTSIMMMLLLSWGVSAQGQFFDDIYYSSKSEDKEKEVVEKPVEEVQEEEEIATDMTSDEYDLTSTYTRSGASLEEERDVDEYNRRYSDYPEDEWEEVEQDTDPVKTKVSVEPERRSDLEYSERIIRYHSPSKISIVGADQVDLYVDDGYYAYDYATDYSGGITNVSVNLNFGSPWYSWGWYDPWYYPWGGYYSSWWYRPYYWGWSGWYAGSSSYFLLTRRVGDGWVAAYDENWNIVRYDLSSFEMSVEGDDAISRRFAFKCKLTGKDADIEMEALGDSIDYINDTYFHLGSISTGSQGLVMSEGPSIGVDSNYYMDILGPDSTGELLNYENGDVIEVTLSNYFLELYGSDITGTIKATVSSGDFLITDADFTMDGFEISITDDDVTIVKNGGIDYWEESTFLSAAKRIIQEARGKLDDPDLVSFTQRRELKPIGTSLRLIDDDFIDRDFVVEECSLTRDKSGNESFECRLSNEMARISLSALNCIVTSYVQE